MKKLAIIALAALTLAPSAANASWHDFTCVLFAANCDRSNRYQGPWWNPHPDETRCSLSGPVNYVNHLGIHRNMRAC